MDRLRALADNRKAHHLCPGAGNGRHGSGLWARFTGRKVPVPLSDEERRRLEKLEQDLAATDPELNLALQSGRLRGMAARAVLGAFALLAGFALILAGITTQITAVGVIGFLLAGAGTDWLLRGLRPLRGFRFRTIAQGDGKSSPSGSEPGST